MKPVVSASQIAVQAYAQRTNTPARVAGQSPFTVDGKGLSPKGLGPVRRVSQETDAFKVEISAEALEAARRDAARQPGVARDALEPELEAVAEIEFQPVEAVTAGSGRREAPFAHEPTTRTSIEAPRRPGSVLDISV